MIENFSDMLSTIVIVLIPFIMCILFIRFALRSLGQRPEVKEEKQIEYYKEW